MSQVRFDASNVSKSLRRNQSPYWGEHTARYVFAAPRLIGHRVLDIACGTGYGLPVLRETSGFLVGADIDLQAVIKARAEIVNHDAAVMVADGCNLAFAGGTFDAITSFETLEHLEDRGRFLSELRRVLSPAGLCIISTPNANYTQPINGKPRNPHHVFEYTPAELTAELRNHFDTIDLFGQSLDSRFAISPFWDDQQRLPRTPGVMARLALWRCLNRLPFGVRDSISNALFGHSFYPGDEDYDFDRATVDSAPVLVAVCRG